MKTLKLCVLLFAVGFVGNYIGRWQAGWDDVDASQDFVTNLAGEPDPELTARVVDKYGETFINGGEIEFECDPNDLLIDIVDYDVSSYATCVMICIEGGDELTLSFKDGKLDITGAADMTDAAEVFFNEVLKGMADDYIKERLMVGVKQ